MRTALRVAFVLSGKTQQQIATETGLTAWKVSRIVHGHLEPTPYERRRLAASLGVEPDRIFREDWR